MSDENSGEKLEAEYAELLELRQFRAQMTVLLYRVFNDTEVEGRERIARVLDGVDMPTVLTHGFQTAVNALLDERDRAREAAARLRRAGNYRSTTLSILEGRD